MSPFWVKGVVTSQVEQMAGSFTAGFRAVHESMG